MNIVLDRTYPIPFSPQALDRRLEGWSLECGYRLMEQAAGRRVYERGLGGWRGMFATSVLEIHTRITLQHDGSRLHCSLRCASRLHVETPRWLMDDRQPLRQDLDRLGVWLGGDKAELDALLAEFNDWVAVLADEAVTS